MTASPPTRLPKALTHADLRRPHSSIPANPLLAEPLYLTKYIERMGTGTRDMTKNCLAAGLPEFEFSITDSFVTTIRRVSAIEGSGQDQLTPPVTRQPESMELRVLRQLSHTGIEIRWKSIA